MRGLACVSGTGRVLGAAVTAMLCGSNARAQAQDSAAVAPALRLTLGFAVDTTVVPSTWWGVERALATRPAVVRF